MHWPSYSVFASPNLYTVRLKANRLHSLGLIARNGCSATTSKPTMHSKIREIANSEVKCCFLLCDGAVQLEIFGDTLSEEVVCLSISDV